jgi:hypothetical protein
MPDYFLRNADGCAVVVDVKPDKLIDAKDRVNFAATAALCRQTGWAYRRLSEPPRVLWANLRWLAGYRHERVSDTAVVARTREVIEHSPGVSLSVLAHQVGEPTLVAPTIFHMLWRHELRAELSHYGLSRATSIHPGTFG